jgi:hypothetical protein
MLLLLLLLLLLQWKLLVLLPLMVLRRMGPRLLLALPVLQVACCCLLQGAGPAGRVQQAVGQDQALAAGGCTHVQYHMAWLHPQQQRRQQ